MHVRIGRTIAVYHRLSCRTLKPSAMGVGKSRYKGVNGCQGARHAPPRRLQEGAALHLQKPLNWEDLVTKLHKAAQMMP